jgi:putative ABC transport system permease protein
MLFATWRDLQWRRKRFTIAVIAIALTLGLSLLMSGVSSAFPLEARRVLDVMGARSFLMAEDELGVFTSASVISADAISGGAGFFFWNTPVRTPTGLRQAALIGVDRVGPVRLTKGRSMRRPGEVVVDSSLGVTLESDLQLADSSYRVVGLTRKVTLYGGQPVIFVSLSDAQRMVAGGEPVTKGFVETTSKTDEPPSGFRRVSRATASDDLLRPMAGAQQTIVVIMVLLWIISACIIGSVMFLTVLERIRDFAVFKANGVSNRTIAFGLAVQAVVLAAIGSVFGIALGYAMRPLLDLPVEISLGWTVALPLIATAIAMLASFVGMRRVLSIEPAQAFGAA